MATEKDKSIKPSGAEDLGHRTLLAIPMMDLKELQKLTAYVNDVKKTLMKEGQDYIIDGNKQYTARSGFAKLHQGFFLSDGKPEVKTLHYEKPHEFEFTHRIRRELKTEKVTTKIYGFEAYVTVINVNTGRHASGEGACTVEELHQTHNMSPKWYHRLLATAKTRAWNRAVSNYVGSAEVSAEEMGLTYTDEAPGSQATERKEVESEKKDVYPLPKTPLDTPSWDFKEEVETKGWNSVDGIIVSYLFDMGFKNPESAFEYGHDVAKAWIRNAPGVYWGDGMKEIDTVLKIAGFQYNRNQSRWRFNKPEVVEEVVEETTIVHKEVSGVDTTGVSEGVRPTEVVEEEEPLVPDEEPYPTSEEVANMPPQEPPRSVEEVSKLISDAIPGSDKLLVFSERPEYFRIGKRKKLKQKVVDNIDAIVKAAGGSWDQEKNAWSIPKEAGA